VYLITFYTILTVAYASLMLTYRIGWRRQASYCLPADFKPQTKVSVIIPARNEAANIGACVRSIVQQDYPASLMEIIVVDDYSEDETAATAIAQGDGRVSIVSLRDILKDNEGVRAYKKKALGAGIAASSGSLIVTTDADCVVQPEWLKLIVGCFEEQKASMIIGPVAYLDSSKVLDVFQSLDFTTMQGITAAAHRLKLGGMANGANLAFSRAAFEEVKGYEGIDHLASGDDFLLLHKMQQRFPEQVHYLKAEGAIVRTAAQPSWGAFLQQRVRWASKSGKYSDYRLTAILMLVYVLNVAIGVLSVAALWRPGLWAMLLVVGCIKVLSELLLLYPVARFFRKERELYWFPLLQPLHIAYIILAGFLGFKGDYRWKGRQVK
jgi:cellulose synthase/poly-beta-1,6-N-acetylglucosamine synthase-like glycosyltransferase